VNWARLARVRLTWRAVWVLPAAPAVVVTLYLAWGAWVSAHHRHWLYLDQSWWRVWLRPAGFQAQFVLVGLWLAALFCYWWPRRLQPQLVSLIAVLTMVLIGGALTASAMVPCRGGASDSAVAGLLLGAYTGNLPPYPAGGCQAPPPLALQTGGVICIAATLTGALAAASIVWRQPMDRLRARVVRDATILTGLDSLTMPLLQRLAETGRPASIVVIEPDRSHPLLDEARATGARVMIGLPSSPRVLHPIIAGWRGCALRRLYALRDDVTDNEAILAAAGKILGRYQPDPDRQPHLVARIDDPRHADHWRGRRVGRSSQWFEDALSCHETTASALLDQVFQRPARQLLLCGDSTLALAILRELARRAWEQQELARAAAHGSARSGRAAGNGSEPPAQQPADPLPVQRVLLLDQRAEDLRREYLATSPGPLVQALCQVTAEPSAWQDELLCWLDRMPAADAAGTTVVVAEALCERGAHEAGRVARLHPDIPVFLLTSAGAGTTGAIFDLLHPFQRALLVDGEVPEDSWIRVARHWHECYRLSHPPDAADPRTVTGRPWAELDDFIRQDNILQLRSIMTAVVGRGRRWVPGRAVAPGSFIELNEHDLMAIARAEHTRWFERRVAAGWSAGAANPNSPASSTRPARPSTAASLAGPATRNGAAGPRTRHWTGPRARVNRRVMPWTALPAADRAAAIEYLRSQLAQLEDAGFMPVVPAGGPKEALEFQRIGTVRAKRLNARRLWTRRSGEHLTGNPGDWRVLDDAGDERTVRDQEFRSSHEPMGGEVWRRTGTYRAWQVREHFILRTMEGKAIARPGDWVVEGFHGERWPVADDQFQRTYRIAPEHEHE
jgi:hypothetical protein